MPATNPAWGDVTLTVTVDDVDVTCHVVELSVDRSKNRVWAPADAGTCRIVLDVTAGGETVNRGQSGDRVKVHVAYGSVGRDLFTGRVQKHGPRVDPVIGDQLILDCVDEFETLGRINKRAAVGATPVGGGESLDARIARWITASGSSSPTALDASTYTAPATVIDGNVLKQIQAAAVADGGDFFVAGNGTLTFKAWAWQTTADTAQAVFSDRNIHSWVPYSSAVLANDLDEVMNDVTGTRRDDGSGTPVPQHQDSPPSITLYGQRGDPLDDLELADDTQVANRAGAWIEVAAFPNERFDSIVVQPAFDPPLMWPQVILVTFSSLIVANRKWEEGVEVSHYGHVLGEIWHFSPTDVTVEYRCSGTGTWDLLRPPRPPICIQYNPDGSISVCDGYPCNDTCEVVLKACDGTVLATHVPGSLCEPGNVFPPEGTCYVCYNCDGFTESCFNLTPEESDAILWLDANDVVANREIERIDGDNPEVPGYTLGFAGTRLDVIDGTHDAIDAGLGGGLVAAAHSSHVAAAHFSGGWTIDFFLWLDNDLDPTPGFMDIIDLDSIKIRLHGLVLGSPVTQLELMTISSGEIGHFSGRLADVPIGIWSHWRILWDAATTNLTVYLDGVIQ